MTRDLIVPAPAGSLVPASGFILPAVIADQGDIDLIDRALRADPDGSRPTEVGPTLARDSLDFRRKLGKRPAPSSMIPLGPSIDGPTSPDTSPNRSGAGNRGEDRKSNACDGTRKIV